MKNQVFRALMRASCAAVAFGWLIDWQALPVQALTQFKTAFQKKYVDDNGNEAFKAAFTKATCNTCHIDKKVKKERNPYGDEIAKLIDGSADARLKAATKQGPAARAEELKKLLEEFDKALDEVAKMKNADGELYGDRIEAGKLPWQAAP
jgi:hypothetical protein